MKKLQNLGKTLNKEEQKKIMGGTNDGGPTVVRGRCTGSTGEWTYGSPVWYITCWNDIDTYCSSGAGQCLTS